MSKLRSNGRRLSVVLSLVATIFAPCLHTSMAVTPAPLKPATKADLSSQALTLDSFVDDLFKLDKRRGELGKKASLTRAEFDSLQTSADDLKRRLAEVQNALRAIITKLKDAGEWAEFDSRIAESISDAGTRARFRETSIKGELEELASNLASKGDEISPPLENLRTRVSGSARNSVGLPAGSAFEWQGVAVAYWPEPAMFTTGVRCTLAHARYGLSRIVWGAVRSGADEAYKCACNIPSGYSCYSPPTT